MVAICRPWQGILKIAVRDHRGCDATVTETSAGSFCRLVVWSTSTPLLPKFAGIERGEFKTPKTTSDTLERSTQRTLLREETTGSQMKTRRFSLASTLKREPSSLS